MNTITNGWDSITVSNNSISVTDGYRIIVTSPVGTESTIGRALTEKRISPNLYFKFVKSKLKKLEKQKLKKRLGLLQILTKDAHELGQQAAYEEYAKIIVTVVRHSEAFACGFDSFVDVKDIEKFMAIAKEPDGYRSPVYFKKLEEFPRSIPSKVKVKIKEVKEKRIFDQLWVLYLDYTHETLKTNKDKIREKDPILFGQFTFDKTKYFYITDWVDEYCDLTLEDFASKLKLNDETFEIQKIPEIDCKFIDKIYQEVTERENRLENTNRENYKALIEEENRIHEKAKVEDDSGKKENHKKAWYHRLFKKSKDDH